MLRALTSRFGHTGGMNIARWLVGNRAARIYLMLVAASVVWCVAAPALGADPTAWYSSLMIFLTLPVSFPVAAILSLWWHSMGVWVVGIAVGALVNTMAISGVVSLVRATRSQSRVSRY
jgi:hypothetical protein